MIKISTLCTSTHQIDDFNLLQNNPQGLNFRNIYSAFIFYIF